MTDEKKTSPEGHGDSCCSSSSCCCGSGKKFIAGLLAGLIVTAAVFGFYSAGACAAKGKMCPMTQQTQMQK